MDKDIILNAAGMHDTAARLRAIKGEVQTQLDEIRSRIETLVTTDYVTRVGAKRYQDTFEQFLAGQTESIKAIDSLANYLDQTADAFIDLDSAR